MHRLVVSFLICFYTVQPGVARGIKVICGTNPEHWKEELHLHRQAVLARRAARLQTNTSQSAPPSAASRDMGNIVVLDDSDGVVARRNPFNLDQKTLTFTPSTPQASKYQFHLAGDPYDASAASKGAALTLGDDDSKETQLAFSFPFFGQSYQSIFINSDGNLTFVRGESASTDRSLGRIVAGPPRIAGLFDDLNPSQTPKAITLTSDPTRLIVSWQQVPEWADFGDGPAETFQIRLYPDGRIQFAYSGVIASTAVVGISPGSFQGSNSVVSFLAGSSADYSSTVAERFGGANEVDVETAAQKFFETHDDTYDYVAFFNDLNITAGENSLAFEQTVRNNRTGYGDFAFDAGSEYGSPKRLQAVLNLGPISQYPLDPTAIVRARAESGYNSLKLVAHEVGHLFLAYASVRDPDDPNARPMLGIQLAHWAFNFNAEASVMEGNRIQDKGLNVSPRFVTTATVEQYSPLDQYLMGFRAAAEVPPTFLVTGLSTTFSQRFPEVGVMFNGGRRDVHISEIIDVVGRRTPDYTVAQRRFRIAFVLIERQGTTPSATALSHLEDLRAQFEAFYQEATGGRAFVDTALRHGLALSIAPAAGVPAGATITASANIQHPSTAPLTINLHAPAGLVSVPVSVTIPAGATSADFSIAGVRPGVDEITATPSDNTYDTAYAHVQVLQQSALRLVVASGDKQVLSSNGSVPAPIVLRASDVNNLPYPGVQVQAASIGGGTVTPSVAVADANGQVQFQWIPVTAGAQLQVYLQGNAPQSGVTVVVFAPTAINPSGVVNAASFLGSLSPGAIGTIYGTSLAGGVTAQAGASWPTSLSGVKVLIDGEPAQMLYVSDGQINFLVPSDAPQGTTSITVTNASGTSATAQASLTAVSPGIFSDASTGFGAILNAGTTLTTQQQPAARGQFIEIYCTGLGPVQLNQDGLRSTVAQPQVVIGNVPATVSFSGIASSYSGGLYQVNVQIPQDAPTGTQTLSLSINGVSSNSVKIAIQ